MTPPTTLGNAFSLTEERSSSSGTLTALSSSPIVSVVAPPDGTGTMTVSPTSVLASVPTTLSFTYTAATDGLVAGLGRGQRPFGLDGAFDELDPCRLHDRLSRDASGCWSGDHGLGAHPQLRFDAHDHLRIGRRLHRGAAPGQYRCHELFHRGGVVFLRDAHEPFIISERERQRLPGRLGHRDGVSFHGHGRLVDESDLHLHRRSRRARQRIFVPHRPGRLDGAFYDRGTPRLHDRLDGNRVARRPGDHRLGREPHGRLDDDRHLRRRRGRQQRHATREHSRTATFTTNEKSTSSGNSHGDLLPSPPGCLQRSVRRLGHLHRLADDGACLALRRRSASPTPPLWAGRALGSLSGHRPLRLVGTVYDIWQRRLHDRLDRHRLGGGPGDKRHRRHPQLGFHAHPHLRSGRGLLGRPDAVQLRELDLHDRGGLHLVWERSPPFLLPRPSAPLTSPDGSGKQSASRPEPSTPPLLRRSASPSPPPREG